LARRAPRVRSGSGARWLGWARLRGRGGGGGGGVDEAASVLEDVGADVPDDEEDGERDRDGGDGVGEQRAGGMHEAVCGGDGESVLGRPGHPGWQEELT
jgi:hypothetical protein